MTVEPGVGRSTLIRLTAAKAISNGAFRWIPFFLPTLATAFRASTAQLTTVLGVGEMAGLTSLAVGGQLDRGRERIVMAGAMVCTAAGAALALTGTLPTLTAGYLLVMIGVSLCTVAGHTYLSRRVRYARRARVIGIFETSWAFALLIGAPLAAVLISRFGWRAPFVVFAVLGAIWAVVVARVRDPAPVLDEPPPDGARPSLTTDAWLAVGASAAIAITGLTTVVIAGTWLDEAFGVSTGGVGLVAMAFGGAELLASSTSAGLADRIGPTRATRAALALVVAGLVTMMGSGTVLLVGTVGLFLFFVGFEFSIVTSFAIVSEAMPTARGRILAVNTAVGTLLRGLGVTASGPLYERFGISGPAMLSAVTAVAAVVLLTVLRRRWQDAVMG